MEHLQFKLAIFWGSESCSVVSDTLRPYTVHGILQARILEWVAFPFPGDLPNPGIEPRSPTSQVDSLPAEPQEKPLCNNFIDLLIHFIFFCVDHIKHSLSSMSFIVRNTMNFYGECHWHSVLLNTGFAKIVINQDDSVSDTTHSSFRAPGQSFYHHLCLTLSIYPLVLVHFHLGLYFKLKLPKAICFPLLLNKPHPQGTILWSQDHCI